MSQPNAPVAITADFHSDEDDALGLRLPASNPGFLTSYVCFIDLHLSGQSVAIRPYHRPAKLVQPRPRGLITAQAGLNPTATRIWKLLLDKDLTAEEIADGIVSDSDKSSAGIAESIKCFLDELTVERLLTATEATASRPSDERLPGGLGWSAFLSDRERDGTLTITLNVLALLLTAFRNAERYPDITRLLKERRERLVWQPDRRRYLQLFADTPLYQSKMWALRQYDQPSFSAVTTWAMSLPVMALGMGEGFLGNLRGKRIPRPRFPGKRHSASAGLWDSPQELVTGLAG